MSMIHLPEFFQTTVQAESNSAKPKGRVLSSMFGKLHIEGVPCGVELSKTWHIVRNFLSSHVKSMNCAEKSYKTNFLKNSQKKVDIRENPCYHIQVS